MMPSFRTQGAIAPMTNVRIQFRMSILLRPMHAKQARPLWRNASKRDKNPITQMGYPASPFAVIDAQRRLFKNRIMLWAWCPFGRFGRTLFR
jgi:hypothetical protein